MTSVACKKTENSMGAISRYAYIPKVFCSWLVLPPIGEYDHENAIESHKTEKRIPKMTYADILRGGLKKETEDKIDNNGWSNRAHSIWSILTVRNNLWLTLSLIYFSLYYHLYPIKIIALVRHNILIYEHWSKRKFEFLIGPEPL